MILDLQSSREQPSRDVHRFTEQLQEARSDYEKERLQATIRGTEMRLAAANKQA